LPQAFVKFVADAPATIRKIVEPKLFNISVAPIVTWLSDDSAAFSVLLADLEATGRSVGARIDPICAALDSASGKKLDTSSLSEPCGEMVAKLKDAASTLSAVPWPL